MSATARRIVDEARLLRQSGHTEHSARMLQLAKRADPEESTIVIEQRKLAACANARFKRSRQFFADVVDFLGLPAFFLLMAVVAYLLGPILFVPSW